uniref:Uncharacterized protein n=1 Tax=Chlamydomonas euryale TaxID=1486919 RepID=A0A7R9VDV6_9CHLO
MVGPALPARVRAGKRSSVPTSRNSAGNQPSAQPGTTTEITLEDGTKIPYKIPANMPPVQAQALVAYLQQNPEVAKKAHEQAQAMLKTPGMASAFLQGVQTPAAESAQRFAFLKDDPDLKHVFEDVQANGPEAVQKYWDDEELMVKINAKMKEHQLKQQQEAGVAPRPPPPRAHPPHHTRSRVDSARRRRPNKSLPRQCRSARARVRRPPLRCLVLFRSLHVPLSCLQCARPSPRTQGSQGRCLSPPAPHPCFTRHPPGRSRRARSRHDRLRA